MLYFGASFDLLLLLTIQNPGFKRLHNKNNYPQVLKVYFVALGKRCFLRWDNYWYKVSVWSGRYTESVITRDFLARGNLKLWRYWQFPSEPFAYGCTSSASSILKDKKFGLFLKFLSDSKNETKYLEKWDLTPGSCLVCNCSYYNIVTCTCKAILLAFVPSSIGFHLIYQIRRKSLKWQCNLLNACNTLMYKRDIITSCF